jgi:DNA-binding beta-propeller fold protein YncE
VSPRGAFETAIRAAAIAGTLAVTAAGCAGGRALERKEPAGLAWPADEPRVRLESVIELPGSATRKGNRWMRLLAEQPEFTMGLQRLFGVAWDRDDLIVADAGSGRVARIASGGKITLGGRDVFEQPIGVAVCDREIVVTDSRAGRVVVLDRRLHPVRVLADDLARPTGVACNGEEVFVVETGGHRVQAFRGDGSRRTIGRRGAGPGEFNFPSALAIEGGTLLLGDTLNFRVQRIDAETGQFLGAFGALGDSAGETPRIKGIAVDPRGHVWVSDGYLDQLALYDGEGAFLVAIGRNGNASAEFSFPSGIAANPDGRVVVADSLNRRLQVFRVLVE